MDTSHRQELSNHDILADARRQKQAALGGGLRYGLFAAGIRSHVISRPAVLAWMRRTFAAAFALLGARLALSDN